MNNLERKAAKSSLWAERDLVQARQLASTQRDNSGPESREMARKAKRRKRKANRRVGRAICRNW